MKTASKLTQLQEKTGRLLEKALTQILEPPVNASNLKKRRFEAAEYYLTEGKEYVAASWELLRTGKPRASLATSRWVLEAALNLVWAADEADQIEKRLKLLEAKALHHEVKLLEGRAKLYPRLSEQFKQGAAETERQMDELMCGAKWHLPNLRSRMDSLKVSPNAQAAPDPYSRPI